MFNTLKLKMSVADNDQSVLVQIDRQQPYEHCERSSTFCNVKGQVYIPQTIYIGIEIYCVAYICNKFTPCRSLSS